jgi:hypothetical protein
MVVFIGEFGCSGAKIWHDFPNNDLPKTSGEWSYYYQPTNTATLNKRIRGK